jgi:hypothetical protein
MCRVIAHPLESVATTFDFQLMNVDFGLLKESAQSGHQHSSSINPNALGRSIIRQFTARCFLGQHLWERALTSPPHPSQSMPKDDQGWPGPSI